MPKSFLPSFVLQTPALLPSWELCTLDSLSWTQIYHGNISLLLRKKKKKKKLHYSIQTQPSTPGTCLFSQLSWELPIFTVTNHLHLATFPGYFSLAFDTVNLFPSLKDTPLSGCVIRHSRGYSFFGYHTLSDIEILDFLKFGPRL